MNSSDRHSLDEQTRLVSRYVAGDLSRSERAEFEAWLVVSPALATEVEMERRLRRGIVSAARRGWIQRGVQSSFVHSRRWRVAIAASFIGALAISWGVLVQRQSLSSTVSAAHDVHGVATRTVRLESVRGSGGAPDITLATATAPAELVIEPNVVMLTCEDGAIELACPGNTIPQTPQYPEYEMDLVDRHRMTLAWRSPRQQPVARTQLSFRVRDPGSLAVGDYDVIVRGHSADHEEVVARFWLQVVGQ